MGDKVERISLCMIVRNEGAFIQECLERVRSVVDEIVVVDTGSTDETIPICLQLGATVLPYPWHDDFSAARNFGLRHATGDWILWLDADEVVDGADIGVLRTAIQNAATDYFTLHFIHYYGDTPNADESYQNCLLRLFRNRENLRFAGKIHEALDAPDVEALIHLPVRVHHYGYMPAVMQRKGKHQRNIQIIQRQLNEPNPSPWLHYHIASEYYNAGQHEPALKHLDAGILLFVLSGLKPPSLCYRLKYTILLQQQQAVKALQTIDKAIALYPDYVDLYFIKGLLLVDCGLFKDAEEVFSHCTSLGDDHVDYLILTGAGTFRAWYYLGLCLERLGRKDEAEDAYVRSRRLAPDFAPPNVGRIGHPAEKEEGAP